MNLSPDDGRGNRSRCQGGLMLITEDIGLADKLLGNLLALSFAVASFVFFDCIYGHEVAPCKFL